MVSSFFVRALGLVTKGIKERGKQRGLLILGKVAREEDGLDKKFVIVAMNTEIEQGLEVYYLVIILLKMGASNRWRCREKQRL